MCSSDLFDKSYWIYHEVFSNLVKEVLPRRLSETNDSARTVFSGEKLIPLKVGSGTEVKVSKIAVSEILCFEV